MRLTDKVDVPRTAERFGVKSGEVREAIRELETERGTITLSVTKRKEELTQYLRHVYDQLAKSFSYEDMAHMLAAFHTEIIARGIVNPERFAREAAKAAADVAKIVYPKETASIKRSLPMGETREEILARIVDRLQLVPSVPITVTPLGGQEEEEDPEGPHENGDRDSDSDG